MATIRGIDSYSDLSGITSEIKKQGYKFVCRYFSLPANSKRIEAHEASKILNAGLALVCVYENIHNSYSKFSKEIAQGDASSAISEAKSCGLISGTIYFAVDYDASDAELKGRIKEHFKVLQSTLSMANYATGVYGSKRTCKYLKKEGLVTRTWLAMSTGWGQGVTFNSPDIKQTKTVTVGGIKCDENTCEDILDIGAWKN